MYRRKYIVSGLTLALAGIAGCSGDEDPAGDNGTETEDNQQTDTTEEDETESDATTTTDEAEETTEADEETTTEAGEETVLYGDVFVLETNYAVELEYSDTESGDSGTASAKYHGDDYYLRVEPDDSDDVFEVYHIDDDTYVVMNEETCYLNPGPTMTPDEDVQSESDAEAHGSKPDADLEPSGTTEIDGETVYIFDVSGADVDGAYTLYVSKSTGYLRRVEKDGNTADFHSWGEIDPITEPDMNCQEV